MTILDADREAARLYRARLEYDLAIHSDRAQMAFHGRDEVLEPNLRSKGKRRGVRKMVTFREQVPPPGITISIGTGSARYVLHPERSAEFRKDTGLVLLPLADGTLKRLGPDVRWFQRVGGGERRCKKKSES